MAGNEVLNSYTSHVSLCFSKCLVVFMYLLLFSFVFVKLLAVVIGFCIVFLAKKLAQKPGQNLENEVNK